MPTDFMKSCGGGLKFHEISRPEISQADFTTSIVCSRVLSDHSRLSGYVCTHVMCGKGTSRQRPIHVHTGHSAVGTRRRVRCGAAARGALGRGVVGVAGPRDRTPRQAGRRRLRPAALLRSHLQPLRELSCRPALPALGASCPSRSGRRWALQCCPSLDLTGGSLRMRTRSDEDKR